MKKLLRLGCLMLAGLMLLAACTGTPAATTSAVIEGMDDARAAELHIEALLLLGHIQAGDENAALSMMTPEMQEAMEGQIAATWQQLLDLGGDFEHTGSYLGQRSGEFEALEMELVFTGATLVQTTVFDTQGLVTGLHFGPGPLSGTANEPLAAAGDLPAGVREEIVEVDAGTGYPLPGRLTLPEGEVYAAVVLLHGSGPQDMDSTVGANTPLKDIAYALAGRGIAVLRYDKRTYVHARQITASEEYARFTVYEEVAEDALAAVALLQAHEDVPQDAVFLAGHSLSGGLLAYIDSLGGGCAGYISLAGSPRKLWEISADQSERMAAEYEAAGETEKAAALREFVDEQLPRAQQLAGMDDAATLAFGPVMGLDAWYQRELARIDTAALHLADGKPILVLQGGRDRQVTETDYNAWQQALAGHPDASFVLYDDLNHMLGAYTGEPVPTALLVEVEYAQRTPVDGTLLADMADWILARA